MFSFFHKSTLATIFAFTLLLAGVGVTQAQSTSSNAALSDLQAQIEQLQQRVQTLAEEVANQQANLSERIAQEEQEDDSPTTSDDFTATSLPEQASDVARMARQLSQGDRGPDVRQLQELLASNSQIYPEGLVTGYFGPLTSQAVTRLQQQLDIPTTGVVGSSTLQQVNTLLTEGAGQSGIIPPGLLRAPGLQNRDQNDATSTEEEATSTDSETGNGQSSTDDTSSKLSPELVQLIETETDSSIESVGVNESGKSLYEVLIRTSDVEQLKEAGISVNSESGGIATARLTVSEIEQAANLESVSMIRYSGQAQPLSVDNSADRNSGAQAEEANDMSRGQDGALPDWDKLPIDDGLRDQLKNSFGSSQENPGRGRAQ